MYIFIKDGYKFPDGDIFPGPPIEHLVFKTSEEAFAGGIVWRTALF